jgi:hypothetical protein
VRGWGEEALRPSPLVAKWRGVDQHSVADYEALHVGPDGGYGAGSLGPERQRRLAADCPSAGSDQVVPVGDPGRPDIDQYLVRGRSDRLGHVEQFHCQPEVPDPCGAHASCIPGPPR